MATLSELKPCMMASVMLPPPMDRACWLLHKAVHLGRAGRVVGAEDLLPYLLILERVAWQVQIHIRRAVAEVDAPHGQVRRVDRNPCPPRQSWPRLLDPAASSTELATATRSRALAAP